MAIRNLVPFGKKSVPVKREDENPFSLLRREMDSLFDNFLRGFDIEPFESRMPAFSPKVDVTENDKEIKISAELPGMDEKDIDVSLQNDMLTIKGEKKEEKRTRAKTITEWSAPMAPSAEPYRFPTKWRRTRSRPSSKRECSA